MQDAKEEVRDRLDIEDVIGEYVQLKRAGRNFKGLSPFTGEKTASFFVSPEKRIWHDFSSNKGGDVFSFVMEVEGMDFRQALEHLARKAGVDLSQFETKGARDLTARKKRLLAAHDLAANYFQQSLIKNPRALDYAVKKRRLNKAMLQEFRIGYAPDDGEALVRFLTKKGFSKKELSEAGLTNRFGGDLFRGRLVLPLQDVGGQVTGFTGRIIRDEPNAPKYLNTPQTLIYDKSRHVFGLSQAKAAIREAEYVVVVEGNMDVVSSHQAGVKNVVATAGTAMTEQQLKALRRLTGSVRLAYDADKAGVAATERALPLAGNVGVELGIIELPGENKDPDELIQRDRRLWQKAIAAPKPAADWVLDYYASQNDLTTAAGKRDFTTRGLTVIRSLPDAVERDHYLKRMATMADSSLEALQTKLVQQKSQTALRQRPVKATLGEAYVNPNRNLDALLALALYDTTIQQMIGRLNPAIFPDAPRQAIVTYLAAHGGQPIEAIPDDLQPYEKYVTMLLLNQDVGRLDWVEHHREATAGAVIQQLEETYQKQQTETLQRLSDEARQRGDDAAADNYLREINQLIKGDSPRAR